MKTDNDRLKELAALHAVGALDGDELSTTTRRGAKPRHSEKSRKLSPGRYPGPRSRRPD